MPEDFLLCVLRQLCEGLKIAHACGVVHLDLKPENVFLKKDGSIKIGDFGCAKILHKSQANKVVRGKRGSPPYMSPEQIGSQGVTDKADIWSFGVLAYEMMTGELPFPGENKDELAKNIQKNKPKRMPN